MSGIQAFDFSVDLLRHVFWSQDRSNVRNLIESKEQAFRTLHTTFWENWYRDVFNLDTANSFGISVWSIILDIPLLITEVPVVTDSQIFGFDDAGVNFDNGNFEIQGAELGFNLLTIEQQRTTLKMIYQKYTVRPTVPAINRILNDAFGDLGTVFVRDNLDMTTEFVFQFAIPDWITYIINELNVLPVPSGVSYTVVEEP